MCAWTFLGLWVLGAIGTRPTEWLFSLLLLVPLESSAALAPIPRMSPIDYGVLIYAVGLLWLRKQTLLDDMKDVAGRFGFWTWVLFLLWGGLLSTGGEGSLKDPLRWGQFLFVVLLGSIALREAPQWKRRYAFLLLGLTCVLGAHAITQYLLSDQNYFFTTSLFKQHNGLGTYLLLTLPPALWAATRLSSHKTWTVALWLIGFSAFVLARSRGSWIGAGIGLCVALMLSWRYGRLTSGRWGIAALIFLFTVAAVGPILYILHYPHSGMLTHWHNTSVAMRVEDERTSQRTAYWRVAYNVIRTDPWTGLVPGRYAERVHEYMPPSALSLHEYELRAKGRMDFWQHLHSLYLQILVQYGVIGYLLWCLALGTLVAVRLSRIIRSPASVPEIGAWSVVIIGFLVHNTVDYLFVGSYDVVFALALASAGNVRE